jgi:hypothetical protein
MTRIAYRWFDLHGHVVQENIYKFSDGTLSLQRHSHHGKYMRDMTAFEVLIWSRQENVTLTSY